MKHNQNPDPCIRYQPMAWDYNKLDTDHPLLPEIHLHLSTCEDCRTLFDRITAIDRQISQQKQRKPSMEMQNRILTNYRNNRKDAGNYGMIHLLTRPLAIAAGIALMITAGLFWGQWIAGKMMPADQAVEVSVTGETFEEEAIITEAGFITPGYNFLNE